MKDKKFIILKSKDNKYLYLSNNKIWNLEGFEIIGYADSLNEIKAKIKNDKE